MTPGPLNSRNYKSKLQRISKLNPTRLRLSKILKRFEILRIIYYGIYLVKRITMTI